ncbi:MAG: LysR family transcriptional regulator, partial [Oscillospiraceae bacterium]
MQKNMEYVYAVYQEHSFSKAAEKLFVSQPALSATIKKLEEELRLSLFNRSSTPISLTPAGECYIRAVEKIADAEAALNEQLSQLTNENRGGISIGGAAFFCAHVLPSIIQEFCRLHPGCTVNLVEGNAADLSKCLQSGVLDLIIDVEQLDANVFESLVWQAEDIIL